MSFFKALRGKQSPGKAKKTKGSENAGIEAPKPIVLEDPWERTTVAPEEITELIRACTIEIKSRELTSPFFILPFRPTTEPSSARPFIRKYFRTDTDYNGPMRGERLIRELRLTDIMVLCSIMKWCWARIPGGVISWDTYELFRTGEVDSEMSRNAFPTFIPISVDSEARSAIIFDFFDLLSAIAANSKHNGLTGLKVSRLAGWWAFEHSDNGFGFEGGYSSWTKAAEATCHMFFAYLRSLAPSGRTNGVSVLPLSLQQLLHDTDYPPNVTTFLREPTSRIIMTVDTVSPTPFSLLRRARNFDFTEESHALQEFSEYDDPVQALTDESKRILKCISASNQSQKPGVAAGLGDQSWSRFQDLGFSGFDDGDSSGDDESMFGTTTQALTLSKRSVSNPQPSARQQKTVDLARPTTPSWADFMASGFTETTQEARSPPPMLLSPDKLLPQLEVSRARSVHSSRRPNDIALEPGELASITTMMLDDVFWMVWMTSLASEEPNNRKAVFGRCAMFDTVIRGIKWVIVEEKVKGALKNTHDDEVFLASKKDKKRTMRGRLTRRRSVDKKDIAPEPRTNGFSTTSLKKLTISPEQHANVKNTAATLRQRGTMDLPSPTPRTNPINRPPEKVLTTASILTMEPNMKKELSPAMTWAKNYDKEAIRDAYLSGATSMTSINNISQKSLPQPPAENGVPPQAAATSPSRSVTRFDTAPLSPPTPISTLQPFNPPPSPKPMRRSPPPQPVEKEIPAPVEQTMPESPAPAPFKTHVTQPSVDIISNKPQPPAPQESKPEPVEEPLSPLRQVISRTEPREGATSPELSDGGDKKVSKLRKLFGGGKASNRRASVQAPPKNLNIPDPKASDRRPSLRGESALRNMTPVTGTTNGTTTTVTAEPRLSPPATPAKIATRETTPAPSIVEENTARTEFSRFDQGPLDVPAFVPVDDDSPEPSPVRTQPPPPPPPQPLNKFSASREQVHHQVPDVPAADNRYDVSPPSEKAEPVNSPPSPPLPAANKPAESSSPVIEPVQDRWAQIRANAAARAKANAAATGGSAGAVSPPVSSPIRDTPSPPASQPLHGGDAADESIESRVARIKARVAQLTSNMEQ